MYACDKRGGKRDKTGIKEKKRDTTRSDQIKRKLSDNETGTETESEWVGG